MVELVLSSSQMLEANNQSLKLVEHDIWEPSNKLRFGIYVGIGEVR